MEIKATDVKALRERTGAGMMECKKALVETNGDAAAAEKLLKEKGLAAVEKRAGRATSEGRVFIKIQDNKAVICELTCETDFVAKNADFIQIGNDIVNTVFEKGYTEVNKELSDMLLDLATKIRENMSLRRLQVIDVPAGAVVSSYVHSDGKTGVVVVITADKDVSNSAVVKEFAYDCCLHMAAFTPAYIKREDVDEAYIAEQTEIFTKQVESLDKPENVKAGIVKGKINKHLADICFMDQPFVKDDKVSVAKKMEEIGKAADAKLTMAQVVLYQLGA
ncbi:MAG: translation elongation factor Ts [Candidatus Treponema excrementipullorum]|nr:translation elongation factor Ts [Spirochaetia bacterium]MCI6953892.1 translation elongation factor Ts [Spirochaetia bacterium]MDD7013110.1 translation elongation factor Ts [Candidatus Treponema excrementipullorum]MDY4465016.1 translation elongation factor Ts [Candidatus Treponema excrementipullorum]MDY4706899.1 translation elongation factor Ts [Candidatus Treponema excrementipullorum]